MTNWVTVWVVTAVDHHIIGVFTSQEKAIKAAEMANGSIMSMILDHAYPEFGFSGVEL